MAIISVRVKRELIGIHVETLVKLKLQADNGGEISPNDIDLEELKFVNHLMGGLKREISAYLENAAESSGGFSVEGNSVEELEQKAEALMGGRRFRLEEIDEDEG